MLNIISFVWKDACILLDNWPFPLIFNKFKKKKWKRKGNYKMKKNQRLSYNKLNHIKLFFNKSLNSKVKV